MGLQRVVAWVWALQRIRVPKDRWMGSGAWPADGHDLLLSTLSLGMALLLDTHGLSITRELLHRIATSRFGFVSAALSDTSLGSLLYGFLPKEK